MEPLFEVRGVKKDHGGLRPLRLAALTVAPGDRVAITGLDAAAAEILVSLLTGATLPDEGEVRVFGRATSAISNADDWLATIDRIGLVSPRAVLAEDLTVAQGIGMALTLSLDPLPDAIAADVRRLAGEVGLSAGDLDTRLSHAGPMARARCRLARALAIEPAVLVLEHANALVPAAAPRFGRDIALLARARRMAVVALTADERFANAVAEQVFAWEAASGQLHTRSGWRRFFR